MCLVPKEVRINVRTSEQIKRDLEITAELRGITVSSLVNSLVVKAIREEKEREPQAFAPKPTVRETSDFTLIDAPVLKLDAEDGEDKTRKAS
jgi:hypothetical protein